MTGYAALLASAAALAGPARAIGGRPPSSAASAPVSVGAKVYAVSKELRDAMTQRKAELASLKVGVGPFRHLYETSLKKLGVTVYRPAGEPVPVDLKSMPKEYRPMLRGASFQAEHADQGSGHRFPIPRDCSDCAFSAKTKWLSGDDKPYGLIIRLSDQGYYLFQVNAKQEVSFFLWKNNQWTKLHGSNWNNLLKGPENLLRVEAQGQRFVGFVNGTQVMSVQDATLAKGQLGMYLDGRMQVLYSELAVQDLEVSDDPEFLGSGYDYAEEILQGMLKSGLFTAAQLGLSNFPPNESWDFVVSAESIGFASLGRPVQYLQDPAIGLIPSAAPEEGGVRWTLSRGRTPEPVHREHLSLPEEWDKPYHGGSGDSAPSETPRDRVMIRLGELLAFRVAERALSGPEEQAEPEAPDAAAAPAGEGSEFKQPPARPKKARKKRGKRRKAKAKADVRAGGDDAAR